MKSSGQHGIQNTIRIFKEVNDFKAVEKLLRGSGIEIPEKYKERIAEGDKFAADINKFADEIREIGPNPIRL